MKIVSANYRDRGSPNRWLIRDANQDPEEAVEVTSVIATGVAFCPSTDFERGFGCSIVAQCQTAEEAGAHEPFGDRLRFDFFEFVVADSGVPVPTCHQLLLQPDGSMWAVIEAPAAAETREMAEA